MAFADVGSVGKERRHNNEDCHREVGDEEIAPCTSEWSHSPTITRQSRLHAHRHLANAVTQPVQHAKNQRRTGVGAEKSDGSRLAGSRIFADDGGRHSHPHHNDSIDEPGKPTAWRRCALVTSTVETDNELFTPAEEAFPSRR